MNATACENGNGLQENMNEVLITGCMPNEYSYDAMFNGTFYGALSYHSLKILNENSNLTFNEFYEKLRKRLPSSRYPQNPLLEGNDENKNSLMFL